MQNFTFCHPERSEGSLRFLAALGMTISLLFKAIFGLAEAGLFCVFFRLEVNFILFFDVIFASRQIVRFAVFTSYQAAYLGQHTLYFDRLSARGRSGCALRSFTRRMVCWHGIFGRFGDGYLRRLFDKVLRINYAQPEKYN